MVIIVVTRAGVVVIVVVTREGVVEIEVVVLSVMEVVAK